MVFLGKKIMSANLMETKFLSLTWTENNILKTIYALKILFLYKHKIMSRQLVALAAPRSATNIF